jgi:hypothetical protein
MKQTRIVFNSEGFRQILLSEGCHEVVQQTTEQIRDRAVQNYAAVSPTGVDADAGISANTQVGGYGGGRWIGFVSTADQYAAAAEAEDAVLTRALS